MADTGLFSSLRVKVALLLAVFSGLLMLSVVVVLEQNVRHSLYRENIDKGLGIARAVAFNAEDPLLTGDDLYLFSAVKNARKAPGVDYALVLDHKGLIRAADDMSRVGQNLKSDPHNEVIKQGEHYRVVRVNADSDPVLDLQVPVYSIAETPLLLGEIHLGLSETPIRDEILAMRYRMAGLALVALIVGSIAAFILAGLSIRPILSLVKGVKAIGDGNLDQHIDLHRRDEIGVLTEAFNDMAVSLREKEFIKNTFERYVSRPLTKVILEHKDDIQLGGEEKEVTILFSDIRRFTNLAEKLPPAQVLELLNAYFTTMIDVVVENEGMVDKLMGDSVMALFGAPVAMGNDPMRAVQCALDMQRAVIDFNRTQTERGLPALEMGIGINTGPVVAGNIGSSRRMEYTVIGDNVNVAARLQGLAKAGEILVSAATWERVRNQVEATAMPAMTLKGKEQAVAVYRIDALQFDTDEA